MRAILCSGVVMQGASGFHYRESKVDVDELVCVM